MKKIICLLIFITLSLALNIKPVIAQLPNSNMNLLANLNPRSGYSACWGYAAPDGREYALIGSNTGTAFVDITDSTNIHEVDFLPGLSSGWREMKTYSHYAYIVSEATNSRLQVVDLQYLPDSVHLVTTWSYPGYTKTHSIQQWGSFLYLHGGNVSLGGTNQGGLTVVDVSNPESPVKRGSWSNEYVHDSRVLNDTIWAANIYSGRITIINALDKDNMETVTFFQTLPNPFTHNCAITVDRDYLLSTDETSSPNGKLKIWDIRNLSNVTFVTQWQPTGITTAIVHNVEVYGQYALVAHYAAGIRLIDITNPAVPIEAAWYDTRPSTNGNSFSGCWGVYMLPSGKIIASDMQTGLYVVKPTILITNAGNINNSIPEKFSLSQNYPNPFNPETNINFSLPKNSHVSLKIFNLAGQQVAELINDRRDAGEYSLSLDATKYGLTSGVYFYRLDSDHFTETKKMMLIK